LTGCPIKKAEKIIAPLCNEVCDFEPASTAVKKPDLSPSRTIRRHGLR
jgi:hypothetical protein